MAKVKTLLSVLVLLGMFYGLYLVLPTYWADYKFSRVVDDAAVEYTYKPQEDAKLPDVMVERAAAVGVVIGPKQVDVNRRGPELGIVVTYTVHIDNPLYPFDLDFKTATKNHDVMK
ncbi:MAG: hypothetical protein P4M01_02770 [Acidobacteriota bacterium]|nr:hypothetical protein [Acidobacteriota bacterium]